MSKLHVSLKAKGDYKKLQKFLEERQDLKKFEDLKEFGEAGVIALKNNTPVDSGKTAASWYYDITEDSAGNIHIEWRNSNVNKGVNIAVILQFGHGTGTGGFVVGRDYINPALLPIFQKIADDAWTKIIRT